MVSKSGISSSESINSHEELGSDVMANLSYKLNLMKMKIQSERVVSIGEKLEKNSKRIQAYASELETLAASRTDFTDIRSSDSVNLLSLRMDNPLCKVGGLIQSPADRDDVNSEDYVFSSTSKTYSREDASVYYLDFFGQKSENGR